MATETRNPTLDIIATGAWTGTAGTRWQRVDDYPDVLSFDTLTHGTTPGHIKFGFSPFSIPAGSTAISVAILYHDYKNGGAQCNIAGALRLGSTPTDHNAASHNPGNGSANITARTDNFPTNPKSGAAWTVNDINGIGSNFLVGFGWLSTDATPGIVLTGIQLRLTYTLPPSVFTKTGRGALGSIGSGGKIKIHLPPNAPMNLRIV